MILRHLYVKMGGKFGGGNWTVGKKGNVTWPGGYQRSKWKGWGGRAEHKWEGKCGLHARFARTPIWESF